MISLICCKKQTNQIKNKNKNVFLLNTIHAMTILFLTIKPLGCYTVHSPLFFCKIPEIESFALQVQNVARYLKFKWLALCLARGWVSNLLSLGGRVQNPRPCPLSTLETKMVTCNGKHLILTILQKYLEVHIYNYCSIQCILIVLVTRPRGTKTFQSLDIIS